MTNPNDKSPVSLINTIVKICSAILNKISKLLDRVVFHKTGSIIVSLILSLVICVAIDYDEIRMHFFNDTSTTVELRDVPVHVLIDDKYFSVEGIPSEVDVTLVGNSTNIQVFRQQGAMQVTADVRQAVEGMNIVDLTVDKLPTDIEASVIPATVEATVSKKVTKQFTVQTELLVGPGQKASDFESPELARTTINIRAGQDKINSIRTVKAIVDATGQIGDFDTEASVAAYDAKGNKVIVEIEPTTIHAKVKLKQKPAQEAA